MGPETIIDNLSLVDSNTNRLGIVFQVRFNAVGTKCTIIAKSLLTTLRLLHFQCSSSD